MLRPLCCPGTTLACAVGLAGDVMPKLFSYGTLRLREVQMAIFGRELAGSEDSLTRFRIDTIDIDDPTVVELSGKATHLVLRPTGDPADVVDGVIFELSEAELAAADEYETADYARVGATSARGVATFVYVLAADVS